MRAAKSSEPSVLCASAPPVMHAAHTRQAKEKAVFHMDLIVADCPQRMEMMAARATPARTRSRKEAGMPGIGPTGLFGGTGGSSTPAAVNFLGGIPDRPDDACASGTCSHSVNSHGIPRL